MSVATITGSARLHLETAVALVGKEQVLAWLHGSTATSTPPSEPTDTSSIISLGSHVTGTSVTTIRKTVAAAKTADKSGIRGRKAGILPTADQRCSWTLNNGEQCLNKRKDANSLCGLHIGKINLISPGHTPTAASSVSGDE
jgi:hypothetical protein